MWLVWCVALALGSTTLDDVRQLVKAEQHIDASGVSAKAGELPDYGFQAPVALKVSCRVWLELVSGAPKSILYDGCPELIQPAIQDSLSTSRWQKTNTPELSGWLPLNLSHYHDPMAPQNVRATFRPARLQEVVRKVLPKNPGGVEEICKVVVAVSDKGKPDEVTVDGCSEPKAQATEKALKKWRWTPVSIGNEAFGFEARFVIRL